MEKLPAKVALIQHMGSDESIVEAARVSYGEGTKHWRPPKDLINYLMMNGHMSPFEFAEVVFYVKAPIFVARQWFRHRTGSFAEKSGRYSVLSEQGYYAPNAENVRGPFPEDREGISARLAATQQAAVGEYKRLLDHNLVREQARIVLPMGTMTEFYYKTDLRNLFNFLKLRLNPHAQAEIRVYAESMLEQVRHVFPHSVAAFENYICDAVTLSGKEWAALVGAVGGERLREILSGVEVSNSRSKWIKEVTSV